MGKLDMTNYFFCEWKEKDMERYWNVVEDLQLEGYRRESKEYGMQDKVEDYVNGYGGRVRIVVCMM